MQVSATVTRAAPAWAGLTGAQAVARELASAPDAEQGTRLSVVLARIDVESSRRRRRGEASLPRTIWIHYLQN